jgi:hypothetical protein
MNALMLHDLNTQAQRASRMPSISDPDGFLSGPESLPPDPLGRWAAEKLAALGDWLSARWEPIRGLDMPPVHPAHPSQPKVADRE